MASVYLSPSVDDQQVVVTGGNEEEYMNMVADAMVPYLRASGIEFDRNDPNMTVAQIIEQSNSKYHDLHLVLNMESGVGNLAGLMRGINVIHYTGSPGGSIAAKVFYDNLRSIYPNPNLVTLSSDRLNPQLRDTDAAAIMTDLGYRDNYADVTWLHDNLDEIAKTLVMSIAEYLEVPFVDVQAPPAGSQSISFSSPLQAKLW
ncbi:N-acetylmuramoyl-L-alanine amidase [Anoxybacterium hadale]|uniref:N-acetylmuramoyl-L-alanine amidase n=1 Tax=Anoxybacterium hadale TaxID=3408580 RepID=A0ACD1A749_9FIRM|nr:N-acetylmuramoyl-L-alanine amidase [Clostridiales bacterium]